LGYDFKLPGPRKKGKKLEYTERLRSQRSHGNGFISLESVRLCRECAFLKIDWFLYVREMGIWRLEVEEDSLFA
jgi:hypothetical protein